MADLRETIRQILMTKRTNRQIANSMMLSHTTIANYRRRLQKRGLHWVAIDEMNDSDIKSILRATRKQAKRKRPIDLAYVYEQMQQPNMTVQLLWFDYYEIEPATAYSLSAFSDKYRKYRRKLDISMRQSHRAGDRVFVDFAGTTLPYTDLASGEEKDAQIFVSAMGCSNYTFSYAVASQSLPDWIEAHNKMFFYLGGVPEVVVPDNLKSAVTKAGRNLIINRTYLEMCKYYGVVVIPTRVRKPKDKAKAEVAVLIVSRWILARLRNRTFFSIEEINQAIAELLWQLNERPFKKLPGNRRSRFEELDKPALKPLPSKPFEYAEWVSKQKVGSDYHVFIKEHYYSVPYELVGEYVEARVTKNMVEILYKGKSITNHPRNYIVGGHSTLAMHQPVAHRKYADLTPDKLSAWAQHIGTATYAAVKYQLDCRNNPLLGVKACTALQRLEKEYGAVRLELACQRAQKIGSLKIKSIKSILRHRIDERSVADSDIQMNLPLHQNVRGASYYEQRRH